MEDAMKIQTSELTDLALDWAVAKSLGQENCWMHDYKIGYPVSTSTDWAQGGPIIEREWLDVAPWPNESDQDFHWQCKQHDSIDCVAFGPTPLIAAMRCYVASKLGDTVDIPEELIK
jgi:hypothetical protein